MRQSTCAPDCFTTTAHADISSRMNLLVKASAAVAGVGDPLPAYRTALEVDDVETWPFDTARVRLLYGEELLRRGRIGQARAELFLARRTFEEHLYGRRGRGAAYEGGVMTYPIDKLGTVIGEELFTTDWVTVELADELAFQRATFVRDDYLGFRPDNNDPYGDGLLSGFLLLSMLVAFHKRYLPVEMGDGSGKGEATTSPDPASAGLGVVTSSLSVIGHDTHPHCNRAGALGNYAIASMDLSRRSLNASGSGT